MVSSGQRPYHGLRCPENKLQIVKNPFFVDYPLDFWIKLYGIIIVAFISYCLIDSFLYIESFYQTLKVDTFAIPRDTLRSQIFSGLRIVVFDSWIISAFFIPLVVIFIRWLYLTKFANPVRKSKKLRGWEYLLTFFYPLFLTGLIPLFMMLLIFYFVGLRVGNGADDANEIRTQVEHNDTLFLGSGLDSTIHCKLIYNAPGYEFS